MLALTVAYFLIADRPEGATTTVVLFYLFGSGLYVCGATLDGVFPDLVALHRRFFTVVSFAILFGAAVGISLYADSAIGVAAILTYCWTVYAHGLAVHYLD